MRTSFRLRPLAGALTASALALGALTLTAAPADAATVYKCNRIYYTGEALTAYGDSGNRVIQAQCGLVSYGRLKAADVDGQFGSKTRAAVIAFQNSLKYNSACGENVSVDGIVGPVTWYFLRYGCG
ncbi:peptidoglycan-binding domain-containing protein [Streptomyces sp. NPDC001941]|uniref:peptidoglycan-binding domain-containing protein n=1 Tax=Streptomyces sp. NPDC001941 TaxID=3154659 RepID=UPI003324EAE4